MRIKNHLLARLAQFQVDRTVEHVATDETVVAFTLSFDQDRAGTDQTVTRLRMLLRFETVSNAENGPLQVRGDARWLMIGACQIVETQVPWVW